MKIGLDIFSGAGGLSLGAEMAGIEVRFAVEKDPSAAATFRFNHQGATVFCEDIQNLDPVEIIGKDNELFIIMGGPPCQGFSLSNTMTRNMENPNNLLFKEFVRFVDKLQPKWVLFENVYGLTNIEKGATENAILKSFEAIGYKVKEKVLWASDFGVPQKRNRFFIVGNRCGVDFEFPEPQGTNITVEEAIGDLPDLQNGDMFESLSYKLPKKDASEYAKMMRAKSRKAKQNFVSRNNDLVIERYKYIGQGENWQAIPEFLMKNYTDKSRCHSGIYKRLRSDAPSVVISNYRKMMLIHPTQDRGLSVREAARIQSFPDIFIFQGPLMRIQQQIGNAVPPLLAKAVIEKIISYES